MIFEDNIGGNVYNPWAMLHPAAQGAANLEWPQSRGSGQIEAAVAPGTTFASAGLADPADNGGPTETMAIAPGSPAIDAGTSTGAPPTDQRGYAAQRRGRHRRVRVPGRSRCSRMASTD